jgi:antitoxin component YwqK of YwqJK toxin-antitoxin module
MRNSVGWRAAAAVAALLFLSAIAAVLIWRPAPAARHLTRAELDLREGVLFAKGEGKPFNGVMVERYSADQQKLTIEIANGKAHGLSRGWFENGQLEVEERFANGISHGPRTRWHMTGQKKSEARIEQGQLSGPYVEWHENGTKAVQMELVAGKAEGLAEAWHPSGALKSQTRFRAGEIIERHFFDDTALAAQR